MSLLCACAAPTSAPYRPLGTHDGTLVSWPSCLLSFERTSTLDNAGLGPALDAAIARIEAVSPYRFVERANAPITLDVVDRALYPQLLPPGVAANGGGNVVAGRFVSGSVLIAADTLGDYDAHGRYALVLHELLHVLGLGHVDDPHSVMVSRISRGAGDLGPGDVEGLRALSAQSCGA